MAREEEVVSSVELDCHCHRFIGQKSIIQVDLVEHLLDK